MYLVDFTTSNVLLVSTAKTSLKDCNDVISGSFK